MSIKKLEARVKKVATTRGLDLDGARAGCAETRHVYDSALVKIFGRRLGVIVSNYLIKLGLRNG